MTGKSHKNQILQLKDIQKLILLLIRRHFSRNLN